MAISTISSYSTCIFYFEASGTGGTIYLYDLRTNVARSFQIKHSGLHERSTSILAHGNIYFVGGNNPPSDTVLSVPIPNSQDAQPQITEKAHLHVERGDIVLAKSACQRYIYAIGGRGCVCGSKVCERFDTSHNRWYVRLRSRPAHLCLRRNFVQKERLLYGHARLGHNPTTGYAGGGTRLENHQIGRRGGAYI